MPPSRAVPLQGGVCARGRAWADSRAQLVEQHRDASHLASLHAPVLLGICRSPLYNPPAMKAFTFCPVLPSSQVSFHPLLSGIPAKSVPLWGPCLAAARGSCTFIPKAPGSRGSSSQLSSFSGVPRFHCVPLHCPRPSSFGKYLETFHISQGLQGGARTFLLPGGAGCLAGGRDGIGFPAAGGI